MIKKKSCFASDFQERRATRQRSQLTGCLLFTTEACIQSARAAKTTYVYFITCHNKSIYKSEGTLEVIERRLMMTGTYTYSRIYTFTSTTHIYLPGSQSSWWCTHEKDIKTRLQILHCTHTRVYKAQNACNNLLFVVVVVPFHIAQALL